MGAQGVDDPPGLARPTGVGTRWIEALQRAFQIVRLLTDLQRFQFEHPLTLGRLAHHAEPGEHAQQAERRGVGGGLAKCRRCRRRQSERLTGAQ